MQPNADALVLAVVISGGLYRTDWLRETDGLAG
jgi:hypothetical protein